MTDPGSLKLDAFGMLDRLAEYNSDQAPSGLSSLRNARVLHQGVCNRDKMCDVVADFAHS